MSNIYLINQPCLWCLDVEDEHVAGKCLFGASQYTQFGPEWLATFCIQGSFVRNRIENGQRNSWRVIFQEFNANTYFWYADFYVEQYNGWPMIATCYPMTPPLPTELERLRSVR